MFKKLKEKLTEEVKIPSQKFTQSMQQFAQAVVSPVSSNNSSHDAASNDNFSIDGDFDDTPQSSPTKKGPSEVGVAYRGGQATSAGTSFDSGTGAGFTHVDLQQDTGALKSPSGPPTSFTEAMSSLRSSRSSLASDSSFMFPVLESAGPSYSFQSDLESCSEASESVGPNINKEQLLVAYRKIQQKYHKYKGRYTDLARHYRDLERDNKNTKHVLTECQDKALRRMAELKEQCNLEKQAKAHLEEALRSDLEEKDHLIHTLKTKIKLLRSQADQNQELSEVKPVGVANEVAEAQGEKLSLPVGQEDLLTGGDSGPVVAVLTPEPVNVETDGALKEKVKKLESLLQKCKEDITNKRESIKQLEVYKSSAGAKIEALQQQLITIQKREEEASLSLAKNKQTIHLELESKEEEIKKLNVQLAVTKSRVSELLQEISQIKEDSKKELIAGKLEATKLSKLEMEEVATQKKTLEVQLAAREKECKVHEDRVAELLERIDMYKREIEPLKKSKEELEGKLSSLENNLKEKIGQENQTEKLRLILHSFRDLSIDHKHLKENVISMRNDSLAWFGQQNQQIQEKMKILVDEMEQDYKKVLAEMNEYKGDSVNARESLATVSNKVILLEETVMKEKIGLDSKLTDLEKELLSAEQQISSLEQSLQNEKKSRSDAEEELQTKTTLFSMEIEEGKSKCKALIEKLKLEEKQMKSNVDQLKQERDEMEQRKAKVIQDFENLSLNADLLEAHIKELEQQSEMTKSNLKEANSKTEELKKLLEDRNQEVADLLTNLSTFKESDERNKKTLLSLKAENSELMKKLESHDKELMAQIADLQKKHQEALDIKDMTEKELKNEHNESDTKLLALQNEVKVKMEEILRLQDLLKKLEDEAGETALKNLKLQEEIEVIDSKAAEQQSVISNLEESKDKLTQCLQELKCDFDEKLALVSALENEKLELQKALEDKKEQLSKVSKFEAELNAKSEECQTLILKCNSLATSISNLEEKLKFKSEECSIFSQNIENLNCIQLEQRKTLKENSEELTNLRSQLSNLEAELSSRDALLLQKSKECKTLQEMMLKLENNGAEEQNIQAEECKKLLDVVNTLEKDKFDLNLNLKTKVEEMEQFTAEMNVLKLDHEEQSRLLREKVEELDILTSRFETLTSEHSKTSQLLKQKVLECEEKEAQLDNLEDEMKRVEELSQELHRINDDRDANVEVLSSEASNLAQKVEELTITTQELKEREVDLLGKLQAAQDLEAEYISLKEREEALLSKLNEAKTLQTELKVNKDELFVKSKRIEELEEENVRLKEAGENLATLINRAKEAEASCERLKEDGANLLIRIQKAEESEAQRSLLEEELHIIKREREDLLLRIKAFEEKDVLREKSNEPLGTDMLGAKNPVTEELCVVKRYADLTENHPNADGNEDHVTSQVNEWKRKYNQLYEEHQKILRENADSLQRLKEESLLAVRESNMKQKERLWDRQETASSLTDGNSNGSFVTVEKLQQQLSAMTSQLKESKKLHRQEVDDLRRILLNHGSSNSHGASRSDNLEDATELEYLRNILFEYMMGKEPMILARVIAAVVKFDSDQTSKVLQREQQRLSLLGHLGIS